MQEYPKINDRLDFDEHITNLAKRHDISLLHAACFTCNYCEPYICLISMGGCKHIKECDAIHEKERNKND